MTIDPKVSMWLNIIAAVIGALAGAGAEWTTLFGQGAAQEIVTIAGLAVSVISAVNIGLHGVSSTTSGPLTTGVKS